MGKVHPDLKLGYVRIYKSGCTSMTGVLVACGFVTRAPDTWPEDYQRFSVVRDPVERWVSGVHQLWGYASGVPFWQFLRDSLETQRRTGEVWTMGNNAHLRPQVDFVGHHPITLFPLERMADVMGWLTDRGVDTEGVKLRRRRVMPRHRRRYMENLMTDQDRALLREFYAADVVLHEQALSNPHYIGES